MASETRVRRLPAPDGDAPEPTRRVEILDVAAEMIAASGIRTSLKEIADACGIQPGSLYHHFVSKEALIVELVERFHQELEDLAAEAQGGRWDDAGPTDAVIGFGSAIAESAIRHRAALLLSYYDAAEDTGPVLKQLSGRTLPAIVVAMASLLEATSSAGEVRKGLDLTVVADRICQSMLQSAIGVYHRTRGGRLVPKAKCRIILDGLAAAGGDELGDDSAAHRAAEQVIDGWSQPGDEEESRAGLIRRVARAEFAKRGFDATTIRDVAASAGINNSAVYRVADSKEQLLALILEEYSASVTAGWTAILQAEASPLERLDALLWFNVNVLDRFTEEHRIQSLGMQQSPPTSVNLAMAFPAQLRQLRALLAEGEESGQLRPSEWAADVRARCVFSLVWTPDHLVHHLGTKGALELARDTVLRGIASPGR